MRFNSSDLADAGPSTRLPPKLAGRWMSPDIALLLACLQWPNSARRHATIDACATEAIHWDHFLNLARRHRVLALVNTALSFAGVRPPEAVAIELAKESAATGWSEIMLAGELRKLLHALQSSAIEATVLKGIAVSIIAYGRLGLRFNRDIDILVAPDAISASVLVLEHLGYIRVEPPSDATAAQVARWMRRQKDLVFCHPDSHYIVELHWRLFDNRHLMPVPHGQARQIVGAANQLSIPTLPGDFNFVYLCVHGAEHGWSRLKWLADVNAILANSTDGDVRRICALSRQIGVHRAVAQGLLLCADLFDSNLPAELFDEARKDWRVIQLAKIALRSMFSGGSSEIEDQRFGSTPKTISHYLLYSNIRYLVDELAFDLSEGVETEDEMAPGVVLPFKRLIRWTTKQFRQSGGNPLDP